MDYRHIPGFDKYINEWEGLSKQIPSIKNNKGYFVFFDACDATKHHNKDMLSENGFTKHLFESGINIMQKHKIRCLIFSILDEIAFLFPKGEQIQTAFPLTLVNNQHYLLTILLNELYKEFRDYDDVIFRGSIREIEPGNAVAQKMIDIRKLAEYYTAMEYYAKEYLSKEQYTGKTAEELIELLKQTNLWDGFESIPWFYEGLYHMTDDPMTDLLF